MKRMVRRRRQDDNGKEGGTHPAQYSHGGTHPAQYSHGGTHPAQYSHGRIVVVCWLLNVPATG